MKQEESLSEFSNKSGASLQEIGHVLKTEREKRDLTLSDIKNRTCIPLHHISSIENGLRENLPEDLFLMGFLKRYAKALGLNESSITSIYARESKNIKTKDVVNDDFDLLFDSKDKNNNLNFSDKNKKSPFENEKPIFSVFHFYFFIGLVVFLSVVYLTFNILINGPQDSKNKTFKQIIVENEDEEDFVDEEVLSDENLDDTQDNKIIENVKQELEQKSSAESMIESIIKPEIQPEVKAETQVMSAVEENSDLPELVTTQKSKPVISEIKPIIQKPQVLKISNVNKTIQKNIEVQVPIQKSQIRQVVKAQKPQLKLISANHKPKQVNKPAKFCNIPKKDIKQNKTVNNIKPINKLQVNKAKATIARPQITKPQAVKPQVLQVQKQNPVTITAPVEEEIMLRPLRVVE